MSSCSCNLIHQFEIQTLVKQDKFCMVITWKHYSYWFLNLDSLSFFIPRNALGLVKFTAISVGRKWHSKYKKITQEKCSESIFQKIVYTHRASIGLRLFSTELIIIFWLFLSQCIGPYVLIVASENQIAACILSTNVEIGNQL